MTESIIDGIRQYIADCPLMSEFDSKKRHINWTDADSDNYGIFPDCDEAVESYIDGSEERKYVCSVIIRKFSKAEKQRIYGTSAKMVQQTD